VGTRIYSLPGGDGDETKVWYPLALGIGMNMSFFYGDGYGIVVTSWTYITNLNKIKLHEITKSHLLKLIFQNAGKLKILLFCHNLKYIVSTIILKF